MCFFSPLEQFEVVVFWGLNFFNLFIISITNVTLFLAVAFFAFVLYSYMSFIVKKAGIIPNKWQYVIESFYLFLLGLIKEQLGHKELKFFPMLFLTFMFIMTANLMGLVPYSFTTTSHIIITFLLAFSFNLSFVIIGFQRHGLSFLRLFIPSGIKGPLLVLIVVIEVFSYAIRSISLSVRLFANMLAGHTLIHLILTFGLFILKSKYFYLIIAPLVFFLAIFVLEVVIALVQAYVFVLLLCIYLNETLHIAH